MNVYLYDVVYEDGSVVTVEAANFSVTKTDVTFYDEEDNINFWFPIDTGLRYVRKAP